MLSRLRNTGLRQILSQILNLCLIGLFYSLYVMERPFSCIPIVVVLSGSMEPAFQRGDILLLDNRQKRVNIGDIVVYRINKRDIPIVHRVIQERHGEMFQKVLTKGDNNRYDDIQLYSHNQMYIDREDIIGVVKGFVPYLGWITLALNDFPKLKYCIIGGMGLMTLINRE
ncbi:signal peptidase I [Pneumocystis murina B123]|uniref:Signal peptidase complex catalytic subunit SEC11 n=1 Tax=Pneumocystis murina (strain B123) TaxID=1069680 RepID=M7PBR8_PNEMU|nr:signal peptidase I [Pneumocystis murina B123]EMR11310.1 signal peptidase I [Pneumocystis murina B123]